MSRGHAQVRRGQVISTYGPGALIDLPKDSAIMAGLDTWPQEYLEEITEPRLAAKLESMTKTNSPRLLVPPTADDMPGAKAVGIVAYAFPEWFLVQSAGEGKERERSRQLVHWKRLDGTKRKTYEGKSVVPTRFVRACSRGHVDDIDWYAFVHGEGDPCRRNLWLIETGNTGDLAELRVECECGKKRRLSEAADRGTPPPLGHCNGRLPWLGKKEKEQCNHPSRLLIRTSSNAYFPQVVSVLSLPDSGDKLEEAVKGVWSVLKHVDEVADIRVHRKAPEINRILAPFEDEAVLQMITTLKRGGAGNKTIRKAELDALLDLEEGYGDEPPVDPNFHAKIVPSAIWRKQERLSRDIQSLVQVHRLREVMALAGFTRLEPVTPDINGEYDPDGPETAKLGNETDWFPAVENRGEGIFLQLRSDAVDQWLNRPAVQDRLRTLEKGHELWKAERKSKRAFPGGPYVLLHTLSHLLLQSIAMQCGYPASSLRERIYVDTENGHYGFLLYTGSPDAQGTLGGLVREARNIEIHLENALRSSALCSNDPICSQSTPDRSRPGRELHGAACHGCTFVSETSCEMRNDYLDRALVIPVIGLRDAAFFGDR